MTSRKSKDEEAISKDQTTSKRNNLILHNDDVHTFDYVIQALMEICEHDYIQASQCTMITHYKGKCEVKQGTYSQLKFLKSAFSDKELITTID